MRYGVELNATNSYGGYARKRMALVNFMSPKSRLWISLSSKTESTTAMPNWAIEWANDGGLSVTACAYAVTFGCLAS